MESFTRGVLSVVLLTLLNFTTIADRFCVAGVLSRIQSFYSINDSTAGLLSTAWVVVYVFFTIVVSIVGDRMNRKLLILGSSSVWIGLMVGSSFIPSTAFGAFIALRSLCSIGNAFTMGLVVSMIGDWFTGARRGYALMVYYWSLPLGSVTGVIVSSSMGESGVPWQWSLRVWPCLAIFVFLLVFLLVEDPRRGSTEASAGGIFNDFRSILTVKSYLFVVFAITINNLSSVSQAWWTPLLILKAIEYQSSVATSTVFHGQSYALVQTFSGVLVVVGSVVGASVWVSVAQVWKDGRGCCLPLRTPRAFPLMGALCTLITIPLGLASQPALAVDVFLVYFLNIAAAFMPAANYVMGMDVLMEVIPSRRRATATSLLYMVASLLGECTGPYIAGAISDRIRGTSEDAEIRFHALVVALYVTGGIYILSVVSFLGAAWFMTSERVEGEEGEKVLPSTLSSSQQQIDLKTHGGATEKRP